MIRNYISVAIRNISRNASFSLLSVLGLSIGMVAFLLIIHYVRFEHSYERFHQNADNIFRITLDLYNGNEYVVTDCETYAPLGPLLKERLPEVIEYVRMYHLDGLQEITVGDQAFLADGMYFADESVFSVFSMDILEGDQRTALQDPYSIVLNRTLATRYFGQEEAVGKVIEVAGREYKVTAVFDNLPPNTHLKYQALLSHTTLANLWGYDEDNWNGNNEYTYLLMKPQTDVAGFNEKLAAITVSLRDKVTDEQFMAEPITSIHLHSDKSFEPEPNGSAEMVSALLVVAFFVLAIAWINYVNLSTARALERAREVGIRKVMGSFRVQLVAQFLMESAFINIMAVGFALLLFCIGLPFFRILTDQPLPFDLLRDTSFWILLCALAVTGTVLSGLYPALVLSSFRPAAVLKGSFKSSVHGQRLRKALVVFQFAATLVLLTALSVVFMQINYLRSYRLGMDLDQTMVIRATGLGDDDSLARSKSVVFKNEVLRRSGEVKAAAMTETVPGLSLHELSTTSNVKRIGFENAGGSYNYYHIGIDADFIPLMGIKFTAGRNFESGKRNDDQVIINREAVFRLGFPDVASAVGSTITFRTRWPGAPSTIIGVIENYYQQSPKEQQIPMIFRYQENANYYALKLRSDAMAATVLSVKRVWEEVFPKTVFHYFFLDQKYNDQYRSEIRFGQVMGVFSLLALLIACLGLFGLSSFTLGQRAKEIGIRKVLGASVSQLVQLLSKEFVQVVFIAAVLAIPISYFLVQRWLSGYVIRVDLNPWIFTLPVFVTLFAAALTVGLQTLNTATRNPVNSLKQE